MANTSYRHDWDDVIGSVHFLGEHAVDLDDVYVWRNVDAERVWQRYFEALAQSALTVLRHHRPPDLVKIWAGLSRAVEDS